LEFNPFRNLKYSLFFPKPELEDKTENYFETEYMLTAKGEITKLEIVREKNRPVAK